MEYGNSVSKEIPQKCVIPYRSRIWCTRHANRSFLSCGWGLGRVGLKTDGDGRRWWRQHWSHPDNFHSGRLMGLHKGISRKPSNPDGKLTFPSLAPSDISLSLHLSISLSLSLTISPSLSLSPNCQFDFVYSLSLEQKDMVSYHMAFGVCVLLTWHDMGVYGCL